jgi:hypothetical protein
VALDLGLALSGLARGGLSPWFWVPLCWGALCGVHVPHQGGEQSVLLSLFLSVCFCSSRHIRLGLRVMFDPVRQSEGEEGGWA